MGETAVEFLEEKFNRLNGQLIDLDFQQAKQMEINSRLKNRLFIGKVSEIIGFDKTLELLKECETAFKQQ